MEAKEKRTEEVEMLNGIAAATAVAGAVAHGFKVESTENLPDVEGRLVRMTHEKTGAELAWLDRDDDNMTFAIAFRTIPENDTGVAHIIEHSVLCGSRKYRVREPFVELMKSSFATFLNAWTAPDHTAYPVASRNRADFLNLMDVYLDAVFHPVSVESPLPFRQEGWHWQIDSAVGEPKRNGIVYSEMKGAFASPHTVAYNELDRLLYRDNAYGFVSGGDPKSIPDLTFGEYVDFYRRHYHPSNARVFLDGKVDLDAVLAKLDGFFSEYERREVDTAVPMQKPVRAEKTVPYALADGESPEGKTILVDGWLVAKYDEIEKRTAFNVLATALAGSNEEPLAKALLERGLCEDVTLWCDGCQQAAAMLMLENVADGKADEARAVVAETLRSLAANGLDRERLLSVIAREEFESRERDYGQYPRGLVFFSSALDQWLYGGDPASAFKMSGVFASLRRKVAEGWFEKLLSESLLDNPSHVSVTLTPDPGLAARRDAEERAAAASAKAAWTKEELDAAVAEYAALKDFQSKKDSPEALATLPRVGVTDIPADGPAPEYEETRLASGATLCRAKTQAKGIVYAYLVFPLEGLTGAELADAAFGASLYGELATAKRGAMDVKKAVDAKLGRFSASVGVHTEPPDGGAPGRARAYLEIRAGALEAGADEMAALVKELVSETDFDDPERVGDALTQRRRSFEVMAGGISARHLARSRASASVSESGALEEWTGGIASLRRAQEVDDSFAEKGGEYCKSLGALMRRVVAGGASVAIVSGRVPDGFGEALLAAFSLDASLDRTKRTPLFAAKREGFVAAGNVAAAAVGSFTPDVSGAGIVAARMLSLEYLWTEIRVRGGAYGGSFTRGYGGQTSFLSWNDPTPARTLGVYAGAGDALREAAKGGDIGKYVVSAVASIEPYLTPSAEMNQVLSLVLSKRTVADFRRMRREIVETDRDAVARFADELDRIAAGSSVCVIGGRAQVEAAKDALDSVEEIAK